MRTLYRTRELLAVARLYVASVARKFAYNLRKVEPLAYAFVREVVDAGLVKLFCFDYM